VSGSADIQNDLIVRGTLTAKQIDLTIVSSSVLYQSGSTKFGDSFDDTHKITGSVSITGSISLNGQPIGTGKLDETTFNSYTASNNTTNSGQNTRLTNLETASGSLNSFTSSISTTIKNKLNSENVVSSSAQLTGSYDTRYILSGSITQTTWDNIANKPSDIVSGSIQVNITGTTGYSAFSSSISNSINDVYSYIATDDSTQNSRIGSLETESGSIRTTFNSFTSSASSRLTSLESASSSIRSNFNSYTSSNNGRVNALETTTGSLNSFTSSASGRLNALETASGSLNTFSASALDRLSAIETSTSSLNTFTSSIDTTIKNKLDAEGVVSGSIQIVLSGTTGYSTFSSSISASINTLSGSIATTTNTISSSVGSLSSSLNTRINTVSSSLGTVSSSVVGVNNNLSSSIGSLSSSVATTTSDLSSSIGGLSSSVATTDNAQNGRLDALETSTSSLNTYTSSTNGRLTSIETSTSSLNTYTSSNDGRVSALETASSSLNSFTSSINTTIKNKLNADGVISGSIQVNITGTTGYSTFSSSIATTDGNQNTRLTSIESKTGSYLTTGSNSLTGSQYISGSISLYPTQDPDPLGQTTTATHLFVSASNNQTGQDLYIRQQDNKVKWKWFEGKLNSGILWGGALSYSGSQIYITKGSGIVVDQRASATSEISPITHYVNWNDITASCYHMTSSLVTYVGIDISGSLYQQDTFFTVNQYRQTIPIGMFNHTNRTSITSVANDVITAYDDVNQTANFIQAFGPIKLDGLAISPQTNSLRLTIESGQSYIYGGFYQQDPNDSSHKITNQVITPQIARIRRNGSGDYIVDNNNGAFYTTINPGYYDDGSGTLQSTGGGSYSIQRVFFNPFTNRCHVYYGQTTYGTKTLAVQGLITDNFVEAPYSTHQYVFLGYLVVKGNTSDLSDTATNTIVQSGLFRNTVGSTGGSQTFASLHDLDDTNVASAVNGDLLVYNSNGSLWESSKSLTGNYAVTGGLVITGDLTARSIIVSSSVMHVTESFASGSHIFGNSFDDVHQFTGSVNITGSLYLNGSIVGTGKLNDTEFYTYTSSTDPRISALEAASGSIRNDFNSYTSSNNTLVNGLNTFSSSAKTALSAIETSTSSLNTFTSSASSRLTSIETSTSSLNTFSSSAEGRLSSIESATSSLNSYTSSNNTIIGYLETATSSLNTFTASADGRLGNIETSTSSLNTFTSSASGRLNSIETSTSSLNTFTSSADGRLGFLETASGSILSSFNSYTSSNNGRVNALEISSGSLNMFTSSASGQLSALETHSSSVNTFTSSVNGRLSSIETSTSSLNTYTSSADGRLSSLENQTGSIRSDYNSFTSSIGGRVGYIELFTSSLEIFTGSISGRVGSLETASGSIRMDFNTFTSSYRTGSFTGSFTGSGANLYDIPASGITGLNLSQIVDGFATASISSTNGLRINTKTEISGSLIIGSGSLDLTAPEILHVQNSGSYNIAHFDGNQDNYAQINLKNNSNHNAASADIVITADNGSEYMHYVDMGINSSTYNAGYVGYANDAYLINAGNDLYVGTVGGLSHPSNLNLFSQNHWETPQIQISGSKQVGFNTTNVTTGYQYEFSGSIKANNDLKVDGAVTASIFTGSFKGDGTNLYNIPASGVTGLELFKIVSGSVSASISPDRGLEVNTDLTVVGTITAKEIHTSYVTSSVLFESGSTKFGDSLDDVHQFTGSVKITGSLYLNGTEVGTGKLDETTFNSYTASVDPRLTSIESKTGSYVTTSSFNDFTSSISLRTSNLEVSSTSYGYRLGYLESYTSSINTYTGSLNSKISGLEQFTGSLATTGSNTFRGNQVISGSLSISGSLDLTNAQIASIKYLHNQNTLAMTWSVNHGLGYDYPSVIVYDNNNRVMIPDEIISVDSNHVDIYFSVMEYGHAFISTGGLSTATADRLIFTETGSFYNTQYNIGITGSLVVNGDVDANNFNTTSDKKLKTNLVRIEGALDKIEKLNGYTFDWLEEYSEDRTRQIGMIADEVYEVQPELISKRTALIGGIEEEIKLLDYSKVTALLLEAIKELNDRVVKLESKKKKTK
jgi:hypothetical protein